MRTLSGFIGSAPGNKDPEFIERLAFLASATAAFIPFAAPEKDGAAFAAVQTANRLRLDQPRDGSSPNGVKRCASDARDETRRGSRIRLKQLLSSLNDTAALIARQSIRNAAVRSLYHRRMIIPR